MLSTSVIYQICHWNDPDSDDTEGKDFSEDDLSVHLEDHSLGQDYDSSSEVASGVFDAS